MSGSPGAPSPQQEVTNLLVEWKQGNKAAMDLLTPLVYNELRRLAERYLRNERSAATLQPTALVHEAYLRLVAQSMPDWESRAHFFGVAAHLMRQILVDHARKHRSAKRGGGAEKLNIDEIVGVGVNKPNDIIALDDALKALAEIDERKAKVIELRFFGGLSVDETAVALGISAATVGREQRMAEAWLHRELSNVE
jgi:RNA polymerase sigma factor (TIGR02999 family)